MAVKKCISFYREGEVTKSGGRASKRSCKAWSGLGGYYRKCVRFGKNKDGKPACKEYTDTPAGAIERPLRSAHIKSFAPSTSLKYDEGLPKGRTRWSDYKYNKANLISDRPARAGGGVKDPGYRALLDQEKAIKAEKRALAAELGLKFFGKKTKRGKRSKKG